MTVFLLVVSFIIDGVLILALFTMMNKVRQAEELELRQKQVASEIEDLFTSYLLEIKEENKRMEEWIRNHKELIVERTETEEHAQSGVEEEKVDGKKPLHVSSSYSPPQPEIEQQEYRPSIHSRVLELKEKGYSFEEIAKMLDKGKTEIELLYKFHQKTSEKT
ncbi:hypothetical protein SAMN04487936_11066 [Halobacillus dabanensis]|uniref:Uncharacterized protein n=1 Tax=Halobacillus dabanensis TaxID=240302 RepID=A0A1I3Y6E9_HALDA|nr:hypothetical protein [Halobacillus dabanensis]SFK27428.1 hypothetical protein SAMN04487936_11066 [Halobacillus dabanensis]